MASQSNSSAPLVDELRRVPVPVTWCGEERGDQDVSIRFVRNVSVAGSSPPLAVVVADSGMLVTNCKFFRDMAQRFEATPPPPCTLHQVTIHVDGDDVVPYIDCFTTLYKPPQAGKRRLYEPSERLYSPSLVPNAANIQNIKNLKNVNMQVIKNILKLLGAASHIGYDALSTSICDYLVEMHVFSGVVMELAKSELRKEGVPHLIRTYCHSSMVHPHKSSVANLLREARLQGWTPAPTFEQGTVAIVEEELKSLLSEAHNECGGESALADGTDALQMEEICAMLKKVCDMLQVLLMAEIQSEGVKWLLQNSWIPKFLSREVILTGYDRKFNEAITTTMVTVYEEVEGGRVFVDLSDLYVLLKDWTLFMESFRHREAGQGQWVRYEKAKKAIFGCLPKNMKMELLAMEADRGCFVTFGKAEEVWKLLK